MIEEMESEGKTVAEAVENALKKLGLPREQVEVQILQEASAGILGFGSKPARVKITRKHWGDAPQPQRPAPRAERNAGRSRQGDRAHHARERGGHGAPSSPKGGARPAHKHADRSTPNHSRPPHREPQRQHVAPHPTTPATPPAAQEPAVPADPAKACAATEEVLKELLGRMLFTDASISARWDSQQERVKTHVKTAESERLIGPEGKTLEALQFIMTLLVSRRMSSPVAVQVDTNDYWQKKENEVLSLALKGIENVRNTGKPFRMQPMDAPMRRLIHKSLANHPDIMTTSEGDGPWRKIVLRPRK